MLLTVEDAAATAVIARGASSGQGWQRRDTRRLLAFLGINDTACVYTSEPAAPLRILQIIQTPPSSSKSHGLMWGRSSLAPRYIDCLDELCAWLLRRPSYVDTRGRGACI